MVLLQSAIDVSMHIPLKFMAVDISLTEQQELLRFLLKLDLASTTNFPSSKFHIRADSGTAGAGAILETFTPSNATAGVARFVGSRTVTAGTKFWVTPGQSHSVLGGCYGQPIPSTDISGDGTFTLDSVTGLSTIYYSQSNNGGIAFGTTGSANIPLSNWNRNFW